MESLNSQDAALLSNPSVDEQLATTYGAMQHLGWEPKYAGPFRLIGFTPKKKFWLTGEEIMAEVTDGCITFSSKINYDKANWNATRKDKNNVKAFQEAFEQWQKNITQEQQGEWLKAVEQLREQTKAILTEQKREDEEIEQVMHISSGKRWVTLGLIGMNILYFIVMVIVGVGIFEPSNQGLIDWGANFAPYTLGGEWWRLFTSMFMHIGVIHLLFNMYALFIIGAYIEPMLGTKTFATAYVCTGIAATLTSTWWHDSNLVSAGASGAIFGMYGVFLALLSTNLIPPKARKEMLSSIGIMVVYNLVYGLKAGVDNAAHVGGLLSGLVVGYMIYLGIQKPALKTGVVFCLLLATSAGTWTYLTKNGTDTIAYEATLKRFDELQGKALAPFNLEESKKLQAIKTTSLPAWQQAKKEIEAAKTYRLNKYQQDLSALLDQYAALRIQETTLLIQVTEGDGTKDAELEKAKAATEAQIAAINAFVK